MWLFGILIPAFIAYLIIDLYYTSQPAQDANELPEGLITMHKKDFDEYKARFKNLLMGKKWYERLLDLWQTQFNELGDYWFSLVERINGRYHVLYEKQRQLLKDTVKKVTDDALEVIQELIDMFEAQKRQDKEEIQRLTDENNRKDRTRDAQSRKGRFHYGEQPNVNKEDTMFYRECLGDENRMLTRKPRCSTESVWVTRTEF